MVQSTKLVVFSDLDGTLLDHATYDWSPALPALKALKGGGHMLVLASSKTAREVAPIRAEMGFGHCPAIIENGCGILPPESRALDTSETRTTILDALADLPTHLQGKFTGFSQMSVAEISLQTGLSAHDASDAQARQFSEPGSWSGTKEELQSFLDFLAGRGIAARQGGRFLTLSLGGSKAEAMAEVCRALAQDQERIISIALGDAPNDVEMLAAADIGFLIPNPDHDHTTRLASTLPSSVSLASDPGPKGWNTCILSVTETHKHKQENV